MINPLHYVIEAVAIVFIFGLTLAALSAGIYETPVILGGIAAIAGIAAYDIHKKAGKEQ